MQNYIRKFIHLDYYKITDPEWAGKKLLREHAGELRQHPLLYLPINLILL
jgi:hypothetical protein